jgi:hypothetical protein
MLGLFMLGKKKALNIANYCDTEATRARHTTGEDTNDGVFTSFKKDILNTRVKGRWFYYILLTDGKFPHPSGKGDPAFFPGHVFILEKMPNGKQPYYYFYQSYINHYDLKDHIKHNKNSLKLSYDQVKNLVNDIGYVLRTDVWDKNCTEHWKNFTFVEAPQLEGYASKNNFFMCFRKARVVDCLKHIEQYTDQKIMEIKKVMPHKRKEVYGEASLYDKDQKPLTYKQMLLKLEKLKSDIVTKSSQGSN